MKTKILQENKNFLNNQNYIFNKDKKEDMYNFIFRASDLWDDSVGFIAVLLSIVWIVWFFSIAVKFDFSTDSFLWIIFGTIFLLFVYNYFRTKYKINKLKKKYKLIKTHFKPFNEILSDYRWELMITKVGNSISYEHDRRVRNKYINRYFVKEGK